MNTKILSLKLNENHVFELHYDTDIDYTIDDVFQEITFISNHRDYRNQGPLAKSYDIDYFIENNEIPDDLEVIQLDAYIHSGISISLKGEGHQCRFDTGFFGLLIFKKGELGEKNRGLKGFLQSWNDLLNGNVYYFAVYREDTCDLGHIHKELVESVGGYYGYSDQKDMLRDMLDSIEVEIENKDSLLSKAAL